MEIMIPYVYVSVSLCVRYSYIFYISMYSTFFYVCEQAIYTVIYCSQFWLSVS